jgi:hypothetical protein
MKYLPFDSVLDMVIVLGAHILLWDSVMMLYLFGRETPVWQICIYVALAIPGLLSLTGPAIQATLDGISYIRKTSRTGR